MLLQEGKPVEMENFFSRFGLDIIGKVGACCSQGLSCTQGRTCALRQHLPQVHPHARGGALPLSH